MDETCRKVNHVMKITNNLPKTPSNPSSQTPQNQFALLTHEQHTTAYPDTAATGHFVPTDCPGKALEHTELNVQCANNTHMRSTATIELNLLALPLTLKKATVFKEMRKSLFSVPVLCDGNMEVTFRKADMVVKDQNNNIVLKGKRDTATPL
jgi:hypothetical protein